MSELKKHLIACLPVSLTQSLKTWKQKIWTARDNFIDCIRFSFWVLFLCARRRKKAVIIHRADALGDVVCTLPLCLEIRKKHPECVLIYLTTIYCKDIVELGQVADGVYGTRSRHFKFSSHLLGFIAKFYYPKTADERLEGGAEEHLVESLASSCGLTLDDHQPILYPSKSLIHESLMAHRLDSEMSKGCRLIGINCGPTWLVREWSVDQWQSLVDKIHAKYDAEIIQFGVHVSGKPNVYDALTGVRSLVSCLSIKELVALIAACDLIISIDSGPIHIAGAVATPIVGLYGALNPQFFLPTKSIAIGVYSDVPCLFCHHRIPLGHWQSGCPNNVRCMKLLEVEVVYAAVAKMLLDTGTHSSPEFRSYR